MKTCALIAFAILVVAASAGGADVLWDQPSVSGYGAVDQEFPDYPSASTYLFDDFTVGGSGWVVSKTTFFGYEGGDPAYNVAVKLAFTSDHDYGAVGTVYTGAQVGNDLVFDGLHVSLAPGTYWVTAWVVRPFSGGGFLWHNLTTPVLGSEAWVHNPGGYWNWGTAPLPVSSISEWGSVQRDLSFNLEGLANGSISGLVTLNNWTAPGTTNIPATLSYRVSGGDVQTMGTTLSVTSAGGKGTAFYEISGLEPGLYDVSVKPSHWLANKSVGVEVTPGNASDVSLVCRNGDINEDNVVDFTDYLVLQTQYKKAPGTPTADLNGDGSVNFIDYLILQTSYKKSGDVL